MKKGKVKVFELKHNGDSFITNCKDSFINELDVNIDKNSKWSFDVDIYYMDDTEYEKIEPFECF